MIRKVIYPELKMLVLSGIKGTSAMYEIYFYENTINSIA